MKTMRTVGGVPNTGIVDPQTLEEYANTVRCIARDSSSDDDDIFELAASRSTTANTLTIGSSEYQSGVNNRGEAIKEGQSRALNGFLPVFERFGTHARFYCRQVTADGSEPGRSVNGHLASGQPAKGGDKLIGFLFNTRLLAFVVIAACLVVLYKMMIVSNEQWNVLPYASTDRLLVFSNYAQDKFQQALNWANDTELSSKLSPLLVGLAVSIFSCMLVYMDSAVPGVNPPSPFSPNSKQLYRRQRSSSLHLGYMTALTTGIVVGALIYWDFGALFQ